MRGVRAKRRSEMSKACDRGRRERAAAQFEEKEMNSSSDVWRSSEHDMAEGGEWYPPCSPDSWTVLLSPAASPTCVTEADSIVGERAGTGREDARLVRFSPIRYDLQWRHSSGWGWSGPGIGSPGLSASY
eukprot:gene9305-11946_t